MRRGYLASITGDPVERELHRERDQIQAADEVVKEGQVEGPCQFGSRPEPPFVQVHELLIKTQMPQVGSHSSGC